MVQFWPQEQKRPSTSEKFNKAVGAGLEQLEKYQQKQNEEQAYKTAGLDPSLRYLPEHTRSQVIADQLTRGENKRRTRNLAGIDYSIEQKGNRQQPGEPVQNIGFGAEPEIPGEILTKKAPSKKGTGKYFEPETTGQKKHVPSFEEEQSIAQDIAAQRTRAGIPTDPLEVLPIVQSQSQSNRDYNANIDREKEVQTAKEEKYGQKAINQFRNLFDTDEGSPEMEAYAQKRGEELAREYLTTAQIDRKLAEENRIWKNRLSDIRSLPDGDWLSQTKKTLKGKGRKEKEIKADFRERAAPFIENGMQDLLRDELTQKRYDPETIESWVTDLSEATLKNLTQLPKFREINDEEMTGDFLKMGRPKFEGEQNINPEQAEKFDKNLQQVLTSDPNTNLILLRKAYKEKGIGWDDFKNSLNTLIESGQLKLSPDQESQMDLLNEPPMGMLDKFLSGLRFF